MSGLPPGFQTLDPFVERWAIEGSAARDAARQAASTAELEAFYAAAKDLLVPALDHLDTRPLHRFDAAEQRLMNLMLSLAHVAQAVEVQGDAETAHRRAIRLVPITRSTADAGPAIHPTV